MNSTNNNIKLNYRREKLRLSEYSLFLILFAVGVLLDYFSNNFSLSIKKYVVIIVIGFIINLIYNYRLIKEIIFEGNNIIIKKMNRSYTYRVKDMNVIEQRKFTRTLQRYYILLLKSSDGRKFKIDSSYWPKYFELKEKFVESGVFYE